MKNAFVWLVIVVQFTVPLVALTRAPARYGFQMYSGLDWMFIKIENSRGERLDVPINDYVANLRPDIDWTRRLPEHLCDHVRDAATVTVTRLGQKRCVTCD